MRRDLERRLCAIERLKPRGFELWVRQEDGTVRGSQGQVMTQEEAEALTRVSRKSAFFISEADARI